MTIGIDIEEIGRFKLPKTHAFIRRIFTPQEASYAFARQRPEMHLCGIFCAKEAVRKAGVGSSVLMRDIVISHQKNGKPMAKVAKKGKIMSFEVCISHAGEYAVACAVRSHGR